MQTKYINYYFTKIKESLSKNTGRIILATAFVVLGIVLGIVLSLGEFAFTKVLYDNTETFSHYVSGTANIAEIFFSRFAILIFAFLLIFVFCLNYYTSFLGLIYISYQSMILILAIFSLCEYHGVAGILLTIFFALPVNLVVMFVLAIEYAICTTRAKNCHVFKTKFSSSFDGDFWFNMGALLILFFAIQIIANFIFPLVFRGIFMIDY